MSDKAEPEKEEAPAAPKRPLSFDEVMQSVEQKQSQPPPVERPRRSAQPTFEEILGKARPSEPSRPPVAAQERKSRPPRQGEPRKMPIVVRKPALGESLPPPSAESAPAPALATESVFAQPGADESADFGALLLESPQEKPGRLKPGHKITARIAHLGAEVAFVDLGGKGEGIIDLRELRNDKGDLLANVGEALEGYVLSEI